MCIRDRNGDVYKNLHDDPIWGNECRTIESLTGSQSVMPVVVGGCVRDLILGRKITDLDIATAFPDTARQLAIEFAGATNRKLVEYTHKQAIYRVVASGAPQVDFTDPVGGNRETDLLRRDFTINSLAMGLIGDEKGKIFDPSNGLRDLNEKIIRVKSEDVFDDDPLRVLRAFRFSAELKFDIEPETFRALKGRAEKLSNVAGERIQHEFLAALVPDGAAGKIRKMDESGIIGVLFPGLENTKGVEQNDYHHLNVWEHTLEAINQLEKVLRMEFEIFKPYREKLESYINYVYSSGHSRRALIKLAMLLHDICKPDCRGLREDGRITFIGHEKMGAVMVDEYLERMVFPGYERSFVRNLIRGHLRLSLIHISEPTRPY